MNNQENIEQNMDRKPKDNCYQNSKIPSPLGQLEKSYKKVRTFEGKLFQMQAMLSNLLLFRGKTDLEQYK